MQSVSQHETRMLLKIATLYYIGEKSQQEISEIVGISRPQISKMLDAAKKKGFVTFSIRDPYSEEHQYERTLTHQYGLLDALVVDTKGDFVNQYLADEVTMLLNSAIKDGDIFGIMSGKTIGALGKQIGRIKRKNICVVPFVGGMTETLDGHEANDNAQRFSEVFKCQCYQLNTPAFVSNAALAEALLKEPMISRVLQIAKQSNVALVSIASLYQSTDLAPDPVFQDIPDIHALRKHHAVAGLCGSFLDSNGDCVDFPGMTQIIGLKANDLKNIPKVIGIAMGEHKVEAIKAVLRGKWIDILVTDLNTAKML